MRPALTVLEGGYVDTTTAFNEAQAERKAAREERERTRWHVVYKFYDADDRLLYIGISASLTARLNQHADDRSWFREVASARVEHVQGRQAALDRELELIRAEKPLYNVMGVER